MAIKIPQDKRNLPVAENANSGRAIDGSKDRAGKSGGGSIGIDSMTGKPYFYRGGIKTLVPNK